MARHGNNSVAFGLPCIGVFLAVLFLSVSGWCACGRRGESDASIQPGCNFDDYDAGLCANTSYYNTSAEGCASYCVSRYGSRCLGSTISHDRYNGNAYCTIYGCSTSCERDQAVCVNAGGTWQNTGAETCDGYSCCDAQCQCENQGGTWENGECVTCRGQECCEAGETYYPATGECVPPCNGKSCCDSLNRNLPPSVDTSWAGCVDVSPEHRCDVNYNDGENGTAICNAMSQYYVCTTEWVYSQSSGKCALLESRNCITINKTDDRCTNVYCQVITRTSIGGSTFNKETECYEVQTKKISYMQCSNGIKDTYDESSWTTSQLCNSYLDSLGLTYQEYMNPYVRTGSGGGGDGAGAGSGPEFYSGGQSLNAQGELVDNMASPNTESYVSMQQQLVTTTDTAGNVVIVQNSNGGDSTVTKEVYSNVTCLGVMNGVATLSNGSSSWSCEAMSCSQAMLSYSMRGACSGGGGDGMPNITSNTALNTSTDSSRYIADSLLTIDYSDAINRINQNVSNMYNSWMITGDYPSFGAGIGAVVSAVNALSYKDSVNNARDNKTRDSLWRSTFGSNLDAIKRIGDSLVSVSAGIKDVNTSVGNVKTSVDNVNTSVGGVKTSLDNVNTSVQDVKSATNNVNGSVQQVKTSVNDVKSVVRDSFNAANIELRHISDMLDTEGGVRNSINSVRDSVHSLNTSVKDVNSSIIAGFESLPGAVDSVFTINFDNYYNDHLKPRLDSMPSQFAQAFDSLKVEVKIDSLPHDDLLDSINANLHRASNFSPSVSSDTMDFEDLFRKGYNAGLIDTSVTYDSSLGEYIKSVQWIDSSDVTDNGFVENADASLKSRLDSSQSVFNARSDFATRAYVDTMKKYSGLDRTATAINELFEGSTNNCSCLDVTVESDFLGQNIRSEIQFSKFICEVEILNMTVKDFIKMILRLVTSIFCVFMIIRTIGLRPVGKK